jgi:hypothetical protein
MNNTTNKTLNAIKKITYLQKQIKKIEESNIINGKMKINLVRPYAEQLYKIMNEMKINNNNTPPQNYKVIIKQSGAAQRPANPYTPTKLKRYIFPTQNAALALARRYSAKLEEGNLELLMQKLFTEMELTNMLEKDLKGYFATGRRSYVTAVINDRQRLINTKVPPRFYTRRQNRFARFLNMLKRQTQR